jgi:23S rRNA (uridine2479-2'-O)-methyltransferase
MKPKIKKIFTENNDFQHIEVLKRNREKRNKNNEFFVEGVKSINYAIQYNWNIKTYIYSKDRPLSQWALNVLSNSKAELHLEMPLKLMEKLSDKEEEYSEILAVVSMRDNNLSRIKIKDDMLVVVFDRPSSHGNLGTLMRSCEALKVDGLIVTGHAVDLYDTKTIRASMGTFFSVPAVRLQSHNDLIPWFNSIKSSIKTLKLLVQPLKRINLLWMPT